MLVRRRCVGNLPAFGGDPVDQISVNRRNSNESSPRDVI
jgi:hypothetical protein